MNIAQTLAGAHTHTYISNEIIKRVTTLCVNGVLLANVKINIKYNKIAFLSMPNLFRCA